MSAVHLHRPRFSVEAAQGIAWKMYGFKALARPLPSYEDQNFYLITDSGAQFVLKISSAAVSPELLDLQNQAMTLLAVDETLRCPQVCPTQSGELMTAVTDEAGSQYLARIVTYLPGTVLTKYQPQSPKLLHEIGRFLGQMDNRLAAFTHPAAHRLSDWDVRHASAAIRRHLSAIEQPERQKLVENFLARYETAVLPHLSHLRASIIHNDANEYNLIISPADEVSLIDFGDLVHTITIAELAVAAAYIMLNKPDPLAAVAHLVGGYHAVHPLTKLEQELLYYLIPIRLCVSVVMSAHLQKREPENRYISISAKPAWETLAMLVDIPVEQAQEALRRACYTPPIGLSKAEILDRRQRHLGQSLSVSYREPLKIVRGTGQFLYDEGGRPYLDCVNNVCHVGHSHPRVVEAAVRQMALLNTNTRYLHDSIIHYAERLLATLPDPLSVCFFVNSGSEANDLALRLAWAHTGRRDIIVLDGAYHGNLSSLIAISPYKFNGPGGQGKPAHTHIAPMPDPYRGPYRADDPQAGSKYAAHVADIIADLGQRDAAPAAFIAESLLGCGGQIVLPDGYLAEAYRLVRAAGGVCIADEVQVGLGRVGTHFWGFEMQGVIPDIVTIGKPIGNGHPLAAVVTTPEIAQSFHNGMEYFNTFGGNPVSCAVGLAVLDVIEEERLQENARRVGEHFLAELRGLMAKRPIIGDVRGRGLFIGVELVRDRATLEPAAAAATAVIERMKEHGILLSADGPLHNVLKIKPPIVFTEENADLVATLLDQALSDTDEHR